MMRYSIQSLAMNRKRQIVQQVRAAAIFTLLPVLFSCTERIEWELEYMEQDLLVVEGKITNESGPHEVKLTRPVFEMNGTPSTVSGAVVTITDSRRQVYPLEEDPRRPGVYLTEQGFVAAVNRGYQLRIDIGDRTYT
ncbi:MAG: DUF4249 family protein, partial [Bacteroidetes bacterium]